ncbi:hypothetical protein AB0K16_50535 [Nonomuraea jabiensis]|uniref:hypothetical protein n=1 Tax=Nonomuraea jabiensis TaxID=882448 RepID=UPI003432F824
MWNDRHSRLVIARHGRGDDGSLLEICTYEGMFNLSGQHDECDDCATCGLNDNPDYDAIAAAVTDILGDYYSSRHIIATYMSAAMPYTHALTQHGIHRHPQGALTGTTFNQLYRAPDGHLIEIMFPVAPGTALTVEWSYLKADDPTAPVPATHLPADTAPADVATLITTHLAIHPPTRTTNGVDSMNGADVADMPAPA